MILQHFISLCPPDVEDFLAEQVSIVFPAGTQRACTNFTIVNDDIMESLEEDFIVTLDEVAILDSPIDQPVIGTNNRIPVTIIDDDGKFLFPRNLIIMPQLNLCPTQSFILRDTLHAWQSFESLFHLKCFALSYC